MYVRRKDLPPDTAPITLLGTTDPIPTESVLNSNLVTVRAEFRPDRARAVRPAETISVQPKDVLEIQFDEGQRLWLRGDDYRKQFKASTAREAAGGEVYVVPDRLDMLPRGMQSRGPVKWAIKSLKVLGVDLEKKTAEDIAAEKQQNQTQQGGGDQ